MDEVGNEGGSDSTNGSKLCILYSIKNHVCNTKKMVTWKKNTAYRDAIYQYADWLRDDKNDNELFERLQ